MPNELVQQLNEAASMMRVQLAEFKPQVALVLGSGLNPLADRIQQALTVPFAGVAHMRKSTAEGHVGQFVAGTLAGKRVIAMQGRLHGYEGNTAVQVAFPIWLMHALGAGVLITTNACGAINETYATGDFNIIADHINLTGRNPIANADAPAMAERFFSMTDAYDADLRALALAVADRLGIRVHTGVYLGLLGPSFETPAEIRAFRALGADTVAMSVCEEVIAARHVGMRVLGINLISNKAAGIEGASPTGAEVLDVAKTREDQFNALVCGILQEM